jgi:signal transduction histidine kinase
MRSLEARLHAGLTLSLLLLVAGAWWLGHEALHRTADAFVLTRLQHDAEALIGSLAIDARGVRGDGRAAALPVYQRPYSGHYYVVAPPTGEALRSRSLWDWDLALPPLRIGETAHWHAAGPDGQRLLVWGGGYSRDGQVFTLAVAEDIGALEALVTTFERIGIGVALGGLVLMALVQRRVVRQAFARLGPLEADIARLEQGEAGRLTEGVPSEFLPLVHKVNRLLDTYSKRLERSRNAAGNLAHSIKGPLAILSQQIDAQGRRLPPGLAEAMREQVAAIARRLDRELKRARLAGGGGAGRHFDPAAELPALARVLQLLYQDKTLDIRTRVEPAAAAPFPADREDMLELLGVLMDNACKWANARVECRVALAPAALTLRVEDDGPGCPEADLEAIRVRGARLDEAVGGHGLGLAIAGEICALYGGTLDLGRSDALGGFRAVVALPHP